MSSLAAGMAIGVVGDAGVRANAQEPRLFVGMILILIFAEALGLYGLIVGLVVASTAEGKGRVAQSLSGRPGWARDAETAVPAMLQGVWPEELLQDPTRRPRYVTTAEEFLSELLTGEHVEDFIILPNGTELLGLSYEDTIPEDVRFCMQDCRAAQDFVKKLLQNPEMLEKYRADVEYVDSKRQQRDTLRKDKLDLGKRIREALRMVEAGEVDAELLYVAEMRRHIVSLPSQRGARVGFFGVRLSLGGLGSGVLGY
ncbi:unnamed protein product [Symbiodinium necroappetens]|uniref:V-ATPase proteolipid subunit C-like domain-containing protein n=1 Tax=Symbiodinium necroappetens TaxID=1628268 RepID=A0A813ARL7_9DINO|nr:unnamed protein product [Symbiodinium necroappetens]